MIVWPGPAYDDNYTLESLAVLGRYLVNMPNSPMDRRFVDRASSIGHSIDFSMNNYRPTIINITLLGSPMNKDSDDGDSGAEDGDEESQDALMNKVIQFIMTGKGEIPPEAMEMIESVGGIEQIRRMVEMNDDSAPSADTEQDDEEPEEPEDSSLILEEGFVYSEIVKILKHQYGTKFEGKVNPLGDVIKRSKEALYEEFESEPLLNASNTVINHTASYHFSPELANLDRPQYSKQETKIFIYEKLAEEPVEYWLDLLKTWLIEPKCVEVTAIPDESLGVKLENEKTEAEKKRVEEMSEEDRAKRAELVKNAAKVNAVNLPDSLKASMPPVPDLSHVKHVPFISSRMNIPVTENAPLGVPRPFEVFDLVECDTDFVSIKLHIPVSGLPNEHRLFLPLFQSMFLFTDFMLPPKVPFYEETWETAENFSEPRRIKHTEVIEKSVDVLLDASMSVGTHNDSFPISDMTEHLIVLVTSKASRYKTMIRLMIQNIFFADFTPKRILNVAKSSIASISEEKRDEERLSASIMQRLLYPTEADSKQLKDGEIIVFATPKDSSNQLMGIFRQEPLIKNVVKELENSSSSENSNAIEIIARHFKAIQRFLAGQMTTAHKGEVTQGFVGISAPWSSDDAKETSFANTVAEDLIKEWNANAKVLFSLGDSSSGRADPQAVSSQFGDLAINGNGHVSRNPFPVTKPRFFPALVHPIAVHIPTSSVQTSFLTARAPCNLSINYPSIEAREADNINIVALLLAMQDIISY